MLIDDVTLEVSAGKGGDGVVRFTRTMMNEGPTGGNGGRGGSVFLLGVSDLGALRQFRSVKSARAGNGGNGEQNMRTGADGADKIVRVPVGTVAHDVAQGKDYDIVFPGQKVLVARGGNGGFGNFHFRSSRNTTPNRANPGLPGESVTLRLELKMIADIGLIGYPNVGKSSLLNALTDASSKVGNYRFTTLEPHLGVYFDTIIADIPGLIEGASKGKGLGHKFLQHIERTRVLFHLVAADSKTPVTDYMNIRRELKRYNPKLLEKPEWIVVSRADERIPELVAKVAKALSRKNSKVLTLSILDDQSLLLMRETIAEIAREFSGQSSDKASDKPLSEAIELGS
ncbi:MAG: GTPase ObgE [Candidatus Moraniibacteriota bacterium]|nr:MAG: GTPase ObgE [Candidatus Moranbacteria bacterium]